MRSLWGACLGSMMAGAVGLSAQEAMSISTDAPECSVALREVVSLGSLDDPSNIVFHAWITAVASGDYVAVNYESSGELMVFGADGRYSETLDREGDGPGEFRRPGFGRLRPASGGGVLVLDPGTQRLTILSESWQPVGDLRLGSLRGRNAMELAADAGFVVGGWAPDGGGGWNAVFEALDADGETLDRFAVLPTDWSMNTLFQFPMALDDHGRVWHARPTEYVVEAWDPGGGPSVRLEGRPGWFAPGPPEADYPTDAPAPSVITELRFEQGRLWIITMVADDRWREAVAEAMANIDLGIPIDGQLMLDTVVEVVDPATGRLLARSVHDEHLWLTGDAAYLYTIRDRGLVPKAVLFEPVLEGRDCPAT